MARKAVESYISDVVEKGDSGSDLLNRICAPTLANNALVDIISEGTGGIAVLRIPEDHNVAVFPASGDPRETDLASYSASLVDDMIYVAKKQEIIPVAFLDVVDSRDDEPSDLRVMAEAMVAKANEYGLAILNGENAVLGDRVNTVANLSGTMIGIQSSKNGSLTTNVPSTVETLNRMIGIFDPNGNAVSGNADGVGTKTEIYERGRLFPRAIHDFAAMNYDDTIKLGAIAQALVGTVETRGRIPYKQIVEDTIKLAGEMDCLAVLMQEEMGDRIAGFGPDNYNMSGAAISTINEERLRNLPKPSAGESLIAIRGEPNPRSNGISAKREIATRLYGENWHTTSEGKELMKYMSEPSIVLYPVFKQLLDSGIATSVYHMSGGAFDGKLARPLAKHDLYVQMENIFAPNKWDCLFADEDNASAEQAYKVWQMGNDGFVTAQDPERAHNVIKNFGLQSRTVGQLQEASNGKTGVEFMPHIGVDPVHYSGKD